MTEQRGWDSGSDRGSVLILQATRLLFLVPKLSSLPSLGKQPSPPLSEVSLASCSLLSPFLPVCLPVSSHQRDSLELRGSESSCFPRTQKSYQRAIKLLAPNKERHALMSFFPRATRNWFSCRTRGERKMSQLTGTHREEGGRR